MVPGQLAGSFIFQEMEGDNLPVELLGPQRRLDSAFESAEARRRVLRGPQGTLFSFVRCPCRTFPGSLHGCLDGLLTAV